MGLMHVMHSLLMAQPHKESVTGTDGIATFDTDFKAPAKVVIPFSPVQAGTGDPSPENVRPISGWNNALIYHVGLPEGYTPVDYVKLTAQIKIDTSGIVNWDSYYNGVGVEFRANAYKQYGNIVSAYTGESYNATRLIFNNTINNYLINNNFRANTPSSISIQSGIFNAVAFWYNEANINDVVSSFTTRYAGSANNTHTFCVGYNDCNIDYRWVYVVCNMNGDKRYLMALVPCENPDGVAGFYDVINHMFVTTDDPSKIQAFGAAQKPLYKISTGYSNYGKSDMFSSTGITFTAPSTGDPMTVYGGTVTLNEDGSADVVSSWGKVVLGNLTADQFNSNAVSSSARFTLPRNARTGISSYYCPSIASFTLDQTSQYNGYYVSRMQTFLDSQSAINHCYGMDTNKLVVGTKSLQNVSQADFMTYVTDWEVAYEFATPQTYHFDNIGQLFTFFGTNNIWSDLNGDPTVTYWKHG